MRIYEVPDLEVFNINVERGFQQSKPDMNYGNGGDAWE